VAILLLVMLVNRCILTMLEMVQAGSKWVPQNDLVEVPLLISACT
jgi:hypothetical protein